MKKIATDKMQSAVLRDMIGVASADMVWISGAPSQLCLIDGEYVKRENLDEYDTLAYSLDALLTLFAVMEQIAIFTTTKMMIIGYAVGRNVW